MGFDSLFSFCVVSLWGLVVGSRCRVSLWGLVVGSRCRVHVQVVIIDRLGKLYNYDGTLLIKSDFKMKHGLHN